MGQLYTVEFAKRLDGADNYGNVTDSVKFIGEEKTALFKHQPKTPVAAGAEFFGRIEDAPTKAGGTYRKFVREQQEEGFTREPSMSVGNSGKSSSDSKSDGMRQGMSINNATALMCAFIQTGIYTDSDPKKVVDDLKAFAEGIYGIELKPQEPAEEPVVTTVSDDLLPDIADLFPGAVPANG